MLCNQAREEMARAKGGRIAADKEHAFQAHLIGCPECAGLFDAAQQVSLAATTWQEEAVPHWQRGALQATAMRQTGWQTWMPLAACLIMGLLVLFQAEVTRGPDGWRLAFGEPPAHQSAGMSQEAVTALLQHHRLESTLAFSRVLEESTKQYEDTMRAMLAAHQVDNNAMRTRELEVMQARWQEQRAEDLDLLQTQMTLLLRRQNRQLSDMDSLARRVRFTKTSSRN